MRKLGVFNMISLDGYFCDMNGDMSWAHNRDDEWLAFVNNNVKGGGDLLFGRITYDMMAGYWPTKAAYENDPLVAEQMNSRLKTVFSRTMGKADWNNTRLIKSNLKDEVIKMKNEPGNDIVILGSGTIVKQLAEEGLIDEFRIVIIPVILGSGKSMFAGLRKKLNLKPTYSRAFENGNLFAVYVPVKR